MNFKDINLLSIGNTVQMTGAVFAGEGKTMLVMFPGEHDDAELAEASDTIDVVEMTSEDWVAFLRQTDTLEVEALCKGAGAGGGVGKAVIRKSQRQVDQHVSWRVFRRDGYRCRYCGQNDVPLTVDHLVLWEEGGPTTEANLLSSCRRCNKTRGNLEFVQWLAHPYYRKVAANLDPVTREDNARLVGTLAAIPRHAHVRSR